MGSGNAIKTPKPSVRMSLGRPEGTQGDVSASECLSFHWRSSVLQTRAMAGSLSAVEATTTRCHVWLVTGTAVGSGFVRDHWQFASSLGSTSINGIW